MKAVLVSDLRLFTIFCAIQIFRESGAKYFVISEEAIAFNEYGSFSSSFIKRIKVEVLKAVCSLIVVTNSGNAECLDETGVISSLISHTENDGANQDKYPVLFSNFKSLSNGAVSVFNFLKMRGVNEIFVYNGRFASSQPLCKLAAQHRINLWYYEWGTIPFHFHITPYPIHNFEEHAKTTLLLYENKSLLPAFYTLPSKISPFISRKLNNKFSLNYLEKKISKKYEVVIFLGSSHELSALDVGRFMSNLEFCHAVFAKYGRKQYAIRSHPNQISDPSWVILTNEIKKFVESIGGDFYPPNSNISSYNLIANSDVVVTYHSTICADAYFMGAKVDVFGSNIFKYFIEYCEAGGGGREVKSEKLATLCLISDYVHQQSLHPKWILLLKLFGWVDRLVVKYLEL